VNVPSEVEGSIQSGGTGLRISEGEPCEKAAGWRKPCRVVQGRRERGKNQSRGRFRDHGPRTPIERNKGGFPSIGVEKKKKGLKDEEGSNRL